MLNFDLLEKCPGIVSPLHFVHDFSRKMFLMLYSIMVSEYLFFLKSRNTGSFKTMAKPCLNLHFKFHDFFPGNKEDMKILSFRFLSFRS